MLTLHPVRLGAMSSHVVLRRAWQSAACSGVQQRKLPHWMGVESVTLMIWRQSLYSAGRGTQSGPPAARTATVWAW